ncbi:MAG TPA: sigma-E factor negative regulatory protein [Steroidobacteraceae bacterium]|jgi:sigma-E factor negative regulatory protein RseA
MNEELDSQLSAMFDDELPEAECQLLARRLSRDEALKARWRRYAVIGAAVRSERGVRLETNLAARVSAAISAEPALVGAAVAGKRVGAGGGLRWWQPVAGGAIAAGVAAMSVLWIRAQSPVGNEELVAHNSAPTTIASPNGAASVTPNAPDTSDSNGTTYVVPNAIEPRTALVPQAELANFVVAHSEFSTPMNRRNLLSALVASESGTASGSNESEGANDEADTTAKSGAREDRAKNVQKAK